MLIPACPGAVHDLANNKDLAQIIAHFMSEKSKIRQRFKTTLIGHFISKK